MDSRKITYPVFVVAVLMGTSAWAVHSRAPGEFEATLPDVTGSGNGGVFPTFSELDKDGDGRLSPDDVAQVERLSRQFEAADTNQDGFVDQSEFSAFEVTEGVMPGESVSGESAPAPAQAPESDPVPAQVPESDPAPAPVR